MQLTDQHLKRGQGSATSRAAGCTLTRARRPVDVGQLFESKFDVPNFLG